MAIRSYADLVNAYESGRSSFTTARKNFGVNNTQPIWFDTAYFSGYPRANYYAASPLSANPLKRSTDPSWDHGGDVPDGMTKYLSKMTISKGGSTTGTGVLADYLMFYPFVDASSADEQVMGVAPLPRYTDGEGVYYTFVAQAKSSGSSIYPQVSVKYTDSEGIQKTVIQQGALGAADPGMIPFLGDSFGGVGIRTNFIGPTVLGDKGVRSIDSITMINPQDAGLFCVILFKPLATISWIDKTAFVEKVFGVTDMTMPVIENDACLNMFIHSGTTGNAATYFGHAEFIWA